MNARVLPAGMHPGTVTRLNFDAGFGYVRDDAGRGTSVFVAELVTHRFVQQLQVGQAVRFELDAQWRVGLVPAQDCPMRHRLHLRLIQLPPWRFLARILAPRVPPDRGFGRFRDEP